MPSSPRSRSTIAALVSFVGLAMVACGASPVHRAEPSAEDEPAVKYLAGCVDVVSCGRSLEEAKAFSARCGECEVGRNAVKSVRARFDSLYLEESRRAAGGR